MALQLLLCFTSLLSLAASENYGLSDELVTSYNEAGSVDVLKEEIAKKVTPGLFTINVFDSRESTHIYCTLSNIQLTHQTTTNDPSTTATLENGDSLAGYFMTYDLKMDARVQLRKSRATIEDKNMKFDDSQVVFTVASAKSIGECSVDIKGATFTFRNPTGVTEDDWKHYLNLMGTDFEGRIKVNMNSVLKARKGWICGTIPTKY